MRNELRVTMQVEFLPQEGEPALLIHEQAECGDVFALVAELDQPGLTGERFRAAIAEAFLAGTREIPRSTLA